jgi:signal transduction histidine kinase
VDLGTPDLGAQPYCHRGVVFGRLGCDEGSRCVIGAGARVETEGRRGGLRQRLSAGLLALVQGSAFLGLAMVGLALLVVVVLVPALAVLGVVALVGLPPHHGLVLALVLWAGDLLVMRYGVVAALLWNRRLAQLTRRLSGEWLGLPILESYLPAPDHDVKRVSTGRLRSMVSDPATWRDLLWVVTNASFGWILAMVPVILVSAGLIGGVGYAIVGVSYASRPLERVVLAMLGVALTALALWSGPVLLQAYGGLARAILGPSDDPALAQRVRHLAQTRAEAIDANAVEIRRIERDLHDGAQARLVAMGMALDAAEDLLDTDPEATRKLLVEARQSSSKALSELRALVSGVRPPVLADRGLVDALRALALDSVPRVEVAADPIGRPPPPVESAAYFAVSELLANVTKHAGARQAWIDIRYRRGMLAICVTDNGRGGADLGRGTGLCGIERRLAAFDGVLALRSPPGGPTVAQLEIPCELS